MAAGLAMMGSTRFDSTRQVRLGKTSADLGWDPRRTQGDQHIIRSVGGVHYKTHRLYERRGGEPPPARAHPSGRRRLRPRSPTAPSWPMLATVLSNAALDARQPGRPGR